MNVFLHLYVHIIGSLVNSRFNPNSFTCDRNIYNNNNYVTCELYYGYVCNSNSSLLVPDDYL